MSKHYAKVLAEFNTARSNYMASGHIDKMKRMLAEDNWTIDQIVIMGIGNNWTQLSMIVALAEHLRNTTGNKIPTFSLEHYNRYYEGKTFDEYKTENQGNCKGDCWKIQEIFDITINDWISSASADYTDKITRRTLFFAPYRKLHITARALENVQPELYIGYVMEVIERGFPVIETKREEDLVDVVHDVAQSCVWQNMPKGTDSPGSDVNLNGMVMYRRKNAVEKYSKAPEAEGLWISGPTDYASGAPDSYNE